MIPASLRFPAGRELRGLWQEFAGLSPASLHIGFLLLHHVDAPVYVRTRLTLSELEAAALEALRLTEPATAANVDSLLCLGPGLVTQLLQRLRDFGLADATSPDRWQTTALGRQGARDAEIECVLPTRRGFHFVETRTGASPFVAPPGEAATPLNDPGDWRFEVRTLAECIARDARWKKEHGFPGEVCRLDEPVGGRMNCDRVIVDRAESLAIALVAAARTSIAFLDGRTWKSVAAAPWEFPNAEEARAAVGVVAEELAADAGRAAWLEWAGRRGLSERDAAGCDAAIAGVNLEVRAPRALVSRLQHGSSPEGEFLLVGAGLVRRMLRVELRGA